VKRPEEATAPTPSQETDISQSSGEMEFGEVGDYNPTPVSLAADLFVKWCPAPPLPGLPVTRDQHATPEGVARAALLAAESFFNEMMVRGNELDAEEGTEQVLREEGTPARLVRLMCEDLVAKAIRRFLGDTDFAKGGVVGGPLLASEAPPEPALKAKFEGTQGVKVTKLGLDMREAVDRSAAAMRDEISDINRRIYDSEDKP